jgi:hypothetical protein
MHPATLPLLACALLTAPVQAQDASPEAEGPPKIDGGLKKNEEGAFTSGGQGGRIQRISWDAELLWDSLFSDQEKMQYHDIEPLSNDNRFLIASERRTREETIAAGRFPGSTADEGVWPDMVVEVKPVGETCGELVWEGHVWEHMIQEAHDANRNYGVVAEHPELIHANVQAGPGGESGTRGGRMGGPNTIFRALRFAPDHPGLARLDEDAPTQEDDTE